MQPPFPGKMGADIYENISQRAWSDWQTYQTMLINEKCLSLADPEARKFIQDTMNKFFSGEEVPAVEGYIPPTSNRRLTERQTNRFNSRRLS